VISILSSGILKNVVVLVVVDVVAGVDVVVFVDVEVVDLVVEVAVTGVVVDL